MNHWLDHSREIGIVILLAGLLVLVSFGMSLYSVWSYCSELASLRVEKGLLVAVVTYQIALGIILEWQLSHLVVRGRHYILSYSAPVLLYLVFNNAVVGVFFGGLTIIALLTVYRIRGLARTARDFREKVRQDARDHTLTP